ncbi:hypothetical protein [Companilactobacillus paralimentarius]|uniref:hypothetical protein n=1 Tax=Companilactobacillus paralimentarius TaxID=83526 RepID=UPI00385093C0
MVWIVLLFLIAAIAFTMAISSANDKKKQAEEQNRIYKKFKSIEDQRGNYKTDIVLGIKLTDTSIAGFPENWDGAYSLIMGTDDTVHFSYENSPNLWLTNIDYRPEFQQTTNGTVGGRTGSAVVGGLLLGNAGSTIGAARSRSINTTTRSQELNSFGLLTFKNLDNQKQFSIECLLNKEIYYRLEKEFIHRNDVQ